MDKIKTTYTLIGLASKEVHTLGFIIDGDKSPALNLINIYHELKKRKIDYLWFNEFMESFNLENNQEFVYDICGQVGNLVNTPLGYDSTSHVSLFVPTMHYPSGMEIEVVDLRNKDYIDPITCYSLDGVLHLPDYPYNEDEKENDNIYSFIWDVIEKKYKHLKEESRFGYDDFKPEIMREFTSKHRIEKDRIMKIIDEADDNVEIKIEDRILIKGISVTDPQLIKSILKKEY